jgi:hypothetical protein
MQNGGGVGEIGDKAEHGEIDPCMMMKEKGCNCAWLIGSGVQN